MSKTKTSLSTDKSTMLRKKSTLLMHIQICILDSGISSAVNMFLDFREFESVTAKGIFDSFDCLRSYRMTENYLKTHSFCVICDGAAAMVGSKTGITKLMKEKCPYLIVTALIIDQNYQL
jgi:hypothetical protein